MGSISSVDASYITTASVHDAVFLIGITLSFIMGFFRPRKYTDFTMGMIRRLRYIILVISLSALVYSAGFWFLFANTGTFARSDGVTTEWAGWVARGILITGVTWALAEALFMKIAASLLITAVIFFAELTIILVNFLTTDGQRGIVTAFFIFLYLSALVLVYAWQHVKRSLVWMHWWVPALLFLWIGLDALWAFLSNNFWDVMGFSDTTENWLFAAFDIAFTVTAFIGISIMYATSAPSKDAGVYNQYQLSVQKSAKKVDTTGSALYGVV